jgi:hypothetical protein
MTSHHLPSPIVIFFPVAANGFLRRGLKKWPSNKAPKLPRWHPPEQRSSYDKGRADRVARILRDTRLQRGGIKASAHLAGLQ